MEGQGHRDVFLRHRLTEVIRNTTDLEFRDEVLFMQWVLCRYELDDLLILADNLDIVSFSRGEPSRIHLVMTTTGSGQIALVIEVRGEGVFHVDLDKDHEELRP